jgi:hypothetical protein
MWTPDTTTTKITIGGVDVSAYVPRSPLDERGLPGLSITQMIGKEIDTCELALVNPTGLTLHEWDEIRVTTADGSEVHFGGYVTHIEDSQLGPELDLILSCQDYTVRLQKAVINMEWVEQSDLTILADIREHALPALTDFDFASEAINQGTVPRLRSPRMLVIDLLNELATRMGAEWYVDYDKILHWYSGDEIAAPFGISDTPDYATTFPCADLKQVRDGMGIVNLVTVVGGSFLSDDVTHEYAGDGQQQRFVVPHFYHAPSTGSSVAIEVNSGTDISPIWTAKTVGVKYIDDSAGKDVLFAFTEKYFEFASAPPNLKRAWRITAKYEAPLRVQVPNNASYAQYGLWLSAVLNDSTILDKVEARRRGLAYLAEQAETTMLTGSVDQPGLRAGMVLPITNAARSINASYMIRSLTIAFPGGGFAHYAFEAGDYLPDLYAMLREIGRQAAGTVEWREDEVLDILTLTEETLEMTEVHSAAASQGPYYFSDTPSEAMEFGGAGAFDDA